MAPEDAAARLLVARSEGASSLQDEVLAAWLKADARNPQAWDRMERGWRAVDDLAGDEILLAMARAARAAGPAPWPWRTWASAAAVVAVTLGGAAIAIQSGWRLPGLGQQAPMAIASTAHYATVKGQSAVYDLPDGSRMTLDTNSVVDIAFTPSHRSLRLSRGQAFFDVAHDARRPFTVEAGGPTVTAVGTRFDVRLFPDTLRVVLVQGRLEVRCPGGAGKPLTLTAGQQLDARMGARMVVSQAELDDQLSWQHGFIAFNDTTLAAAATEFNRYNAERIEVPDSQVAALRITGRFRPTDIGRFGAALAQVHPVRMVRQSPDTWEIVLAK
ncbi:MAG: FecR domain-containing protein [Proteobacteria bacterium]|nr:FecR domain-containing protein [Pseudomonadota bacterium]